MIRDSWDGTWTEVKRNGSRYSVNIRDVDEGVEIADKRSKQEAIKEGIIVLEILLKELKDQVK